MRLPPCRGAAAQAHPGTNICNPRSRISRQYCGVTELRQPDPDDKFLGGLAVASLVLTMLILAFFFLDLI